MKNLLLVFSLLIPSVSFADVVTKTCTVDDPSRPANQPAETITITANETLFNGSVFDGQIVSIDYNHVHGNAQDGFTTSNENLVGRDANGLITENGLSISVCSDYENEFNKANTGIANLFSTCQYPVGQIMVTFLVENSHEGNFEMTMLPSDFSGTTDRKFNILPCP